MNILITGKNGQLGSEFQELQHNSKHQFFFTGSKECNIRDLGNIEQFVTSNGINAIINCAAYTAVDNAQDDEKNAFLTNYNGVKNIDEVALKHNIKFIHISTDYVFDGSKTTPYETNDAIAPIGVYGKSKRKGEEVILNSDTDAIIIRTSWLYSSHGSNFVKTMIRLGGERNQLNVVNDQIGSPTYACDLAKACLKILNSTDIISQNQKVYHYANQGELSWADFASEIMHLAQLTCTINPISTEEYPTKAERPKYSVLSTQSIESDFEITVPNWRDALRECIQKLQHSI